MSPASALSRYMFAISVAFLMSVWPLMQPTLAQSNIGATHNVDWQTSPLDLDLRGMNGERYEFVCPPGKPQTSRLVGDGVYTDDSSICTAAVHAGAIHPKEGGHVAIEIRPGQERYVGAERNYIHSSSYGSSWSGSFVVVRPAGDVTAHSN